MNPRPGTPEERARVQLEEAFMDIAELMAEAEESRQRTIERCLELRRACETVWKMASLGEPPEFSVKRQIVRAS